MIGKIIRVEDPSILSVFYPTFQIKSEVSFLDRENDIIYTGKMKPNIKDYLKNNTRRFISLTGPVEEDYSRKEKLLEFVYFSRGKEVPNSVLEQCNILDDQEFYYSLKIFWVSGVWPYASKSEDVTLYSLFKGTIEPVKPTLQTYFQLLDKYPFYVIESSFLTFLQRAIDVEQQDVSPGYKRLLKTFMAKGGNKIKPAVFEYSKEGNQTELGFLNLLLGVR